MPVVRVPPAWRQGAVVGALFAAYLAMAEINRLSADVPDDQGRPWPFTTLMGPSRLFDWSSEGWTAGGFTSDDGALYSWLVCYLLLDFVFIAAYGYLLLRWVGRTMPVWALLVVDVAENVAVLLYGRPTTTPGATWVFIALSAAKWTALVILVVDTARRLALDPARRAALMASLVRLRRALYLHRFSLLPLVPIAVLSLVSGPNLLDQLPDVQRQWPNSAQGRWQGAVAIVAIFGTSIGLMVLGRTRSEFARVRAGESPAENAHRPRPNLLIYVIGPLLVLGGLVANRFEGILWWRSAIFVGVSLLIAAASFWLRKRRPSLHRPPVRGLDPEDVPTITQVGDVLAVSVIVIGGLALVRSFTAVVVLSAREGLDVGALFALLLGVAGATLGWWVGFALLDLLTSGRWLGPRLTVGDPVAFGPPWQWGAAFFWLGAFVSFSLFPLFWAAMGVSASVLLGLAALSLMVGSFVVIAQEGGAPEVFWPLGFRAAPITLLLVGALVMAGRVGGDVDIHGTRNLASGAVSRTDLATAFAAWADGPGCRVDAGAVTLRPMFLVAAEGGGIRAAYWTASALDRLVDEAPCAASSTLFSGGASGGAVGLTVTRFADPGESAEQVRAIADPTALSAAALGLLLRDTSYAATGVPAPARGNAAVEARLEATRNEHWADRAALMESVWQTQSAALDADFLAGPSATQRPSGQLVLTSTSVGTGCRLLVSQVAFASTPPGTDCLDTRQPVAGSVDLLSAYAPQPQRTEDDGATHCVGPLTAATAAMMASRFPFVTPSGVIGPCAGIEHPDQLVDGGYVENTGLGSIVDLADQWLPLVRRYNTDQIRTAPEPTLVVPVVLYLDNGTGSALRPPTIDVTSEALVPLVANRRAGKQQNDAGTLLQRAAAVVAVESLWDAGGSGAVDEDAARQERASAAAEAVRRWRSHAAYVVHQSTFPAVSAPLGWTLSQDSIATMDRAIDAQAATRCSTAGGTTLDLPCARGFGSLADALALLPAAR